MKRTPRAICRGGLIALVSLLPALAWAQPPCDSIGPDLIIADLTGPSNYSSSNGIEAFSIGHRICNIGDLPASMIDLTSDHPVYGKSLFRLTSGHADGSTRFEQLGQSWLLHGFFALSDSFCCTDCQPSDGTSVGVHCGDSNTSASAGTQSALGPKWQVNPATGGFTYPPASPTWTGTIARRLQAHISELAPSGANTSYFVEGIVVSADDALAGNGNNNASYRPATLTGSANAWNLALAGQTVRELAAIYAWAANDPDVVLAIVDVPGDGRMIVAGRANPLADPGGFWHYEYAVYNLNSVRAARAVSIELSQNVFGTNAAFHDVDYHSGDGPGNVNFDGADWIYNTLPAPRLGRWETEETYAQNPSANALRWGTLYNFRFDAEAPPGEGLIHLELFAPGTPAEVSAGPLPVPGFRTGDSNGDGSSDLNDLAALLASYGLCESDAAFNPAADFDRDGCIGPGDLAQLLSTFGR